MLSLGHFGDKLLDYDIHHRACGKAHKIGHCGQEQTCEQHCQRCADRLDCARKHAVCKGSALAFAACVKRHGDYRTLGEILYRYTERERKSAARCDLGGA